MNVMEVIRERRSIRAYKSDPVPDDALAAVLEAVRWAPSWANSQCWEVVVVKDSTTKSKLAATLSKNNPARKAIVEAPVILVLVAMEGKSGFKNSRACTDKGDWYMFDIGLAMENLCLAAHALGLGTVIVGYFDAAQVGKILEVPQGVAVAAMTPLGFPEYAPSSSKRKERAEFVYYEGYGRRTPEQ